MGSSATRASRLRIPGRRLPNICRKDDLTSGRNDDLTSGRNDDVTSGDEEFSAAANRARISAMEAVWKISINSNLNRSHGFRCRYCFMNLKFLIRQPIK